MFLLALLLALAQTDDLPAFELRFEDFPAPSEVVRHHARPILGSPKARMYRTQLRRAALEAPNFAGHLRIAEWGCGTCCDQFAVVNLRSGAVFMPDFLISCGSPQDNVIRGQASLYFRADSTLLVAVGSRNEGDHSGIYYYRWNGKALQYLKASHEMPNE